MRKCRESLLLRFREFPDTFARGAFSPVAARRGGALVPNCTNRGNTPFPFPTSRRDTTEQRGVSALYADRSRRVKGNRLSE